MRIVARAGGFQVTVQRGGLRVRKQAPTMEAAQRLWKEIDKALEEYGKWPAGPDDVPLAIAKKRAHGTIRLATDLALETHWKGTPYGPRVKYLLDDLVEFMEVERQKLDLDDITSEDLDAYVDRQRKKGLTASSVNKGLSALSVVHRRAAKRKPPLATMPLPIERVPPQPIEKWWLRPEDQARVTEWLRTIKQDYVFADLIDAVCLEGFRVSEVLKLEPRHIIGLDTEDPDVMVPGTKTKGAQATIPIYDNARDLFVVAVKRAEANGWQRLFPLSWRQASDRWQEVRAYLGVLHIPTATLRALRRTFAWHSNARGMPTETLKNVLRHQTITTTSGYLTLTGSNIAADSRKYFKQPRAVDHEARREASGRSEDDGGWMDRAIAAYVSTGARPEDVARFTVELMQNRGAKSPSS